MAKAKEAAQTLKQPSRTLRCREYGMLWK